MKARTVVAAVALAGLVLLVGCGGGDDNGTASADGPTQITFGIATNEINVGYPFATIDRKSVV